MYIIFIVLNDIILNALNIHIKWENREEADKCKY